MTMNALPSVDRDFIKTWLRRGRIKEIAEKFDMPPKSAYKILAGDWRNPAFEEACLKEAMEEATKWRTFQQKVNDLKNAINSL